MTLLNPEGELSQCYEKKFRAIYTSFGIPRYSEGFLCYPFMSLMMLAISLDVFEIPFSHDYSYSFSILQCGEYSLVLKFLLSFRFILSNLGA